MGALLNHRLVSFVGKGHRERPDFPASLVDTCLSALPIKKDLKSLLFDLRFQSA